MLQAFMEKHLEHEPRDVRSNSIFSASAFLGASEPSFSSATFPLKDLSPGIG
jgi:hypothetical protein